MYLSTCMCVCVSAAARFHLVKYTENIRRPGASGRGSLKTLTLLITWNISGPYPLLRMEQTHEMNVATALPVDVVVRPGDLYKGNIDFRISRTTAVMENLNENVSLLRLSRFSCCCWPLMISRFSFIAWAVLLSCLPSWICKWLKYATFPFNILKYFCAWIFQFSYWYSSYIAQYNY